MGLQLLATADLHLGRASSGVSGLGEKGSTRHTWFTMIEWAVEHRIDVFVIAGDIVEHDNRYFEALGALEKGLARLGDYGIRVIMVAGNHDYDVLPQIVSQQGFEHVHLLGQKGQWTVEQIDLNGTSIQFAGWSFTTRHHSADPVADFPDDGLDPNLITIGVIHGEYEVRQSSYAPLSFHTLSGAGADAWVMGHIHKPEVFHPSPLIFYPGSPHAMSAKEPGAHGPFLLNIDDNGRINHEQIPVSPVRYDLIELELTGAETREEFRSQLHLALEEAIQTNIEESEFLNMVVFDVNLTGYHQNLKEVDAWIEESDYQSLQREVSGLKVIIRRTENRCKMKVGNLEVLANESSPAGMLARAILDLEKQQESGFLKSLREKMVSVIEDLNVHSTYIPLRDAEGIDQYVPTGEVIDEFLLKECNRLLSEMMLTKEGRDG
jgi:DNA repair protein SbcD/Mre11